MSFKFPYQFGLLEKKRIPYPIVYVYLFTLHGKRRFPFILDTGSDRLMLPKYMTTVLGVNLCTLSSTKARGIHEAPLQVWEGTIPIIFCGISFQIDCSFTNNNKTPFLLGKEGIFDRFNVFFDNDHCETVVAVRKK